MLQFLSNVYIGGLKRNIVFGHISIYLFTINLLTAVYFKDMPKTS